MSLPKARRRFLFTGPADRRVTRDCLAWSKQAGSRVRFARLLTIGCGGEGGISLRRLAVYAHISDADLIDTLCATNDTRHNATKRIPKRSRSRVLGIAGRDVSRRFREYVDMTPDSAGIVRVTRSRTIEQFRRQAAVSDVDILYRNAARHPPAARHPAERTSAAASATTAKPMRSTRATITLSHRACSARASVGIEPARAWRVSSAFTGADTLR